MSDFAVRPAVRARSADTSRAARALLVSLIGEDPPAHVVLADGSALGPPDAPLRICIRTPDAYAHLLRAPGELGFARAYVSGAIDVDGDLGSILALQDRLHVSPGAVRDAIGLGRAIGVDLVRNPPPIPPEEMRAGHALHLSHTRSRDAAAISHHYDVSNEFYRLVLGPAMTYSCAAFTNDDESLEQAQINKIELVCRKLALEPGMRLLDVGCGWGTLVMHAARHHGVHAVGITISEQQHAYATEAVARAGLADRVEIRLQDYREIADGPFDAISSIGMFEHVGLRQLSTYFEHLQSLLRPTGRLLNHQIGRTPPDRSHQRRRKMPTAVAPRGFIQRYVFPDGELHEVGDLVHAMQDLGFEVRHLESLREHYARTLDCWGTNLAGEWDRATPMVGDGRARVWRLYMAACAAAFRAGRLQVHQVLAVNAVGTAGASGMPWRPSWDVALAAPAAAGSRNGVAADVIDLRDRHPQAN